MAGAISTSSEDPACRVEGGVFFFRRLVMDLRTDAVLKVLEGSLEG